MRASQQAQVPRAAPATSYYKVRLKLCFLLVMRLPDCARQTERTSLLSKTLCTRLSRWRWDGMSLCGCLLEYVYPTAYVRAEPCRAVQTTSVSLGFEL